MFIQVVVRGGGTQPLYLLPRYRYSIPREPTLESSYPAAVFAAGGLHYIGRQVLETGTLSGGLDPPHHLMREWVGGQLKAARSVRS